ncbi:MAG: hypothetical protein ACK4SO_01150 [Candidatus Kapaibacteriota bacterium]
MKKVIKILAIITALGASCNHYVAYTQFIQEPVYISELPTAGVLKKGEFSLESNFFKSGGLRLAFNLAPFENFIFGASFPNWLSYDRFQFFRVCSSWVS